MKKSVFIFLFLSIFIALASQIDFQKNNRGGCPFCNEEILASQVFFRGERALGILTHKPALPGHVLIIPQRHVERLEDLSQDEWAEIGEVIKRVDQVVKRAFGYKDYFILQKNGPLAGQSVPHVHFHYVPGAKFLALRFLISPWLKPLGPEEMELLRESLVKSLYNTTELRNI